MQTTPLPTPRRASLFDRCRTFPRQRAAILDDARFLSIGAGVGAGKTWAGARAFLRRIGRDLAACHARGERWTPNAAVDLQKQRPFLHYWAVGPVYGQSRLQEREIADALADYPELLLYWRGRSLWLAGGVLIEFRSGSNPKNLAGPTLDGIWITEAARLNPDAWSDVLRSRLRGRPGRAVGWLITDTTPFGRNWYFEEIWQRGIVGGEARDPAYSNHTWTTADNVISPDTVADVERARRQLPWRYFRRDYLASWEAFAGQVYEEFSRRVHVVPHASIPRGLQRVVAGQDWGWTHPAVFLVGGVTEDALWIVEESYAAGVHVSPSPGLTDCWVTRAKDATQRWGISSWVCDPSRPEDVDTYLRAGIPARPAQNDVQDGIRNVALRLHWVPASEGVAAVRPRLFVSDRCVNTIREFEAYIYPPKARHGNEEPMKENDHAPDAARYLVAEVDRGAVSVGSYTSAEPTKAGSREIYHPPRAGGSRLGGLLRTRGNR